jgi:hypothetical protein
MREDTMRLVFKRLGVVSSAEINHKMTEAWEHILGNVTYPPLGVTETRRFTQSPTA